MSASTDEQAPRAYAPKRFAVDFGLSRSQVYELIYSGELRAVRSGKRLLIPRQAAEEWLAGLPEFEAS
jgi:excisionase family DNA binding protein